MLSGSSPFTPVTDEWFQRTEIKKGNKTDNRETMMTMMKNVISPGTRFLMHLSQVRFTSVCVWDILWMCLRFGFKKTWNFILCLSDRFEFLSFFDSVVRRCFGLCRCCSMFTYSIEPIQSKCEFVCEKTQRILRY